MKLNLLMKDFESKADFVEYSEIINDKEVIVQNNDELKSYITTDSQGFSVRVLVNGAWGFASSNNMKDLKKVFNKSFRLALNSSKNKKEKTFMKKIEINKDFISSKIKINPFEISEKEKIKFLREYNNAYSSKIIRNVETYLNFIKTRKIYVNSLGANINQEDYYTSLFS
jgi:TldD protein